MHSGYLHKLGGPGIQVNKTLWSKKFNSAFRWELATPKLRVILKLHCYKILPGAKNSVSMGACQWEIKGVIKMNHLAGALLCLHYVTFQTVFMELDTGCLISSVGLFRIRTINAMS